MWYCWNVSHSSGRTARYKKGVFVHTTATKQLCEFIWRKWLQPLSVYTLSLGQIRWQERELMCYCFLSMCVHVSAPLSVNGKLISARLTLASLRICFPFFFAGVGDIYMQNYCLSQRENGRETGRERDGVLSALTCYAAVFRNSWCNQTLCSELSCEWSTVIS